MSALGTYIVVELGDMSDLIYGRLKACFYVQINGVGVSDGVCAIGIVYW